MDEERLSRRTVTIGSLFAAVSAAFAGTFLILAMLKLTEAFAMEGTASQLPMIVIGTLGLTLLGFWFALPLTLPAALILGHLSPWLERQFGPHDLRWVQYALGAGAGGSIMLALGFLVDDMLGAAIGAGAGFFAGMAAAGTFRRFCYGSW